MALSERAKDRSSRPNLMLDYNVKSMANPFHPISNPKGIVNVGMAENVLCEELIQERLNRPDMVHVEPWQQYYVNFHGSDRLRESLAKFLTKYFKASEPVDPAHIATAAGVGSAVEFLAFACADQGDCFLMPTPSYAILRDDIGYRENVRVFSLPLPEKDTEECGAYQISTDLLEATYKEALQQGEKVKGVLLPNPLNPTGTIFNRQSVQNAIDFVYKYELHLIVDEVYGLTIIDEGANHNSILSFKNAMDSKRVHFIYGMSKDFALSGFRVGILYTKNEAILKAIIHPCYLSGVSALTQGVLSRILDDHDWVENVYLPNNLRRIREAYNLAQDSLNSMGGVPYESQAAFFNWVKFEKHVSTWEGEWELFQAFFTAGVYVAPGAALHASTPGWFRFTCSLDPEHTKTALERMRRVLEVFGTK